MTRSLKIGILALQGAVEAHADKVRALGAEAVLVRRPEHLSGLDGIILPGGESTTMLHLLGLNKLFEPLNRFVRERPTWGVCAGAILLARTVRDPEQKSFEALDIEISRNAYGRQTQSFIAPIEGTSEWPEANKTFEGVFIRAPRIRSMSPNVRTLFKFDGEPVMIEQNKVLASTFHPELTEDNRIHEFFFSQSVRLHLMDDRFPKFLRILLRKLDFLGLPNLGMLICALAILGFVGNNFLGAPIERFVFDPHLVLAGEWWRLFSFPVEGIGSPLFFILYVAYIYFVMGQLESVWGPGPLTVFTLMSYIAALVAAFATGIALPIWYYVIQNVSLAFGTLFPEVEFYLFFILPVKAKWLAMLAGLMIAFNFVFSGWETKLLLIIVLAPYFLFFGKTLYHSIHGRWRVYKNRKRFNGE